MRKNTSGFTVVELLIVIVIISILATITFVAYNGIQKRSLNTARLTEVQSWQRELMLYYTRNNSDPAGVSAGNYCLGSGFPNGACRNYLQPAPGPNTYLASDNATLMSDLKTAIGSLPSGPRQPINGLIGPFVNIWGGGSGFTITSFFDGGSGDCPAPMTYVYDDGNGALMCQVEVKYY